MDLFWPKIHWDELWTNNTQRIKGSRVIKKNRVNTYLPHTNRQSRENNNLQIKQPTITCDSTQPHNHDKMAHGSFAVIPKCGMFANLN